MSKKMPRLTPKQRVAVGSYLRDLADLMEMRDWTVSVLHAPPSDAGHGATCEVPYGQKHALIAVAPRLLKLDADVQRQTFCHELTHALTSGTWRTMLGACQRLPKRAGDQLEDAYRLHMEVEVDTLANAICPRLPFPPWTKAGK